MALHNIPPYRQSELWVPTLTGVGNVDDVTLINAFYTVDGNVVTCYVAISVDPTVGAGEWTVRCSLPVGKSITDAGQIAGGGGVVGSAGFGAGVIADVANNEAIISGANGVGTALTASVTFGYQL